MATNDRLTKAKERLNAYYDAELAVLSGQSYSIGSRSVTRANLSEIRQTIKELEKLCGELEAQVNGGGKRRAYRIVPRDY